MGHYKNEAIKHQEWKAKERELKARYQAGQNRVFHNSHKTRYTEKDGVITIFDGVGVTYRKRGQS